MEVKEEKLKNTSKVTKGVVFTIILLSLAILWFGTYKIYGFKLDNEISQMKTVDTTKKTDDIVTVRVVVNKKTYSLKEFNDLKEKPTIVEVMVQYKKDGLVKKKAYVSYTDKKKDIEYIDSGSYGRVLIPENKKK